MRLVMLLLSLAVTGGLCYVMLKNGLVVPSAARPAIAGGASTPKAVLDNVHFQADVIEQEGQKRADDAAKVPADGTP
jgi:hypothetical protein